MKCALAHEDLFYFMYDQRGAHFIPRNEKSKHGVLALSVANILFNFHDGLIPDVRCLVAEKIYGRCGNVRESEVGAIGLYRIGITVEVIVNDKGNGV